MPTLEPDRFKEVMRTWAAGVGVVTSRLGDEIHGCTVNSFTSVSLTPPLVTLALAKRLHTYRLIKQSHVFAFNILGEHQLETSDRFAGTARIRTGGISESEERFAVGVALREFRRIEGVHEGIGIWNPAKTRRLRIPAA